LLSQTAHPFEVVVSFGRRLQVSDARGEQVRRRDVRARGGILTRHQNLRAFEHEHAALLESLVELRRDPRLPARQDIHEVARRRRLYALKDSKRRRRVEESLPNALHESQSIVALVVRVGVDTLRGKSRFLGELEPTRPGSDGDEEQLDMFFVELGLHVASQLLRQLPTEESAKAPSEYDDCPIFVVPLGCQRDTLLVGRAYHGQARQRVVRVRRRE